VLVTVKLVVAVAVLAVLVHGAKFLIGAVEVAQAFHFQLTELCIGMAAAVAVVVH
jgi:hypothetical protein